MNKGVQMKYLSDPKTGEASVSLTLMGIGVSAYLVATALVLAGIISTIGPLQEFLYTTTALYFGRRFSFGNKGEFGSDSKEEASKNK